MLVVGCTSVLRVAHKHKGALAEWIVAMRARKPERVVAVALANKLAKIAWAMMSTGESFRTELYQGLKKGLSRIGVSFSKRLASATT